jgi:predicted dehydrogenase
LDGLEALDRKRFSPPPFALNPPNRMKTIGVGVLGAGFMAAQHLRAYAKTPGVRIVALANPSGRNLDGDFSKVGGNVGDPDAPRLDPAVVRMSRNPSDVIHAPDVDIVDICTPTATHLDLAVEALAAGKSVLVEKPMTRNAGEARKLVAAAEAAAKRGVWLMPAMCLRFWPHYVWVRRAIESAAFGKLLNARFRRVAEAPGWGHAHFLNGQASGGALFDLHIHDVDFILACLGRPSAVFASGHSAVSGAIDHVLAQYVYPGGPAVSAEGSWAMAKGFGFAMSFTLGFERATIDFDSSRPAPAFRLHGAEAPWPLPGEGDGYVGEVAHLVEAVRNGAAPTVVTADDGLAAIQVCEAEEASIRSGAIVPVPAA